MCRTNFWRKKERIIIIIIIKIRIGWTSYPAVAMETKKGGFKKNWIPFIKLHETL
jgi:hypothetical protein